jgi:hypothetical protein
MTQKRISLVLKAGLGVLMIACLSAAVVGLAEERHISLRDSPTSTELSDDAPLAEAFLEAFVGQSGLYDPQRGIVQPDETHFDIEIKAAHNGMDIFVKYTVPTPLPSYYHNYSIYQDGEWIRGGRSAVGTEPHGLYEDRITMLVDDGSVKGFANQGGWLTCHEDLRDPFMYASARRDDVAAHPVMGELQGREEVRKYIPQSRDTGPGWWQFDGWDDIAVEDLERYEERHASGVFLDLWHWRSHRSNPLGYSDNEYVFDYRSGSPGTSSFTDNWDADTSQPLFMFDSEITGFYALDWDTVQAQGYGYDDFFFLAEDINMVPFDPDREWQNGDVIPRVLLRTPTESRGSIKADGKLLRNGEEGWLWDVELWRPMDTGFEQADKELKLGRTYNAAVAVHRLAMGSRWHFVSFPFTIGIDTPGDVTANRFEGDHPDWSSIDGATLTVIYPGQTSWQWLTSDDHPGGVQVRTDSMAVIGCHDEIGLGAANKTMETYLAGLAPFGSAELTVARSSFDPGNVVFWFVVLAILILAGAVGIGWFRRG